MNFGCDERKVHILHYIDICSNAMAMGVGGIWKVCMFAFETGITAVGHVQYGLMAGERRSGKLWELRRA